LCLLMLHSRKQKWISCACEGTTCTSAAKLTTSPYRSKQRKVSKVRLPVVCMWCPLLNVSPLETPSLGVEFPSEEMELATQDIREMTEKEDDIQLNFSKLNKDLRIVRLFFPQDAFV